MAFYDDAEIADDKKSLKAWKDQFDNTIVEAGKYIDRIIQDRYGELSKHTDAINTLKGKMEALKTKYPSAVAELAGYIVAVDSQVQAIKDRWDLEVYDKLNI